MKWFKVLKTLPGTNWKIGEKVEMAEADAKALLGTYLEAIPDEENPFEKTMADAMAKLKTAVTKMVEDATVEAASAIEKAAAKKQGKGVVISGVHNRELDDPMYGYKRWSDWFRDVHAYGKSGPGESLSKYFKLLEESGFKAGPSGITGQNEYLSEDGGILVPETLSAQIYARVFDEGSLLSEVDSYSISGNNMTFRTVRDDSRATGSRYGGVVGYWMDEGEQFTLSKVKWDDIKLKLNKLGIFMKSTDELMSDSNIALEQFLTRGAASEINFQMGDAFFNGNGIGKPLGILNSSCFITPFRNVVNRVKFEDITSMWARIHAPHRAGGSWYINQEVETQLMRMFGPALNVAENQNVGGWPVYLPPGGLSASPYGQILGRPVKPVEWCAALGTVGDICFANFGQMAMITKGGVKSAMSIHLRFDYDETVWKFTYRADAQPWWKKALTPYKGTNTLSPFVGLAATTS